MTRNKNKKKNFWLCDGNMNVKTTAGTTVLDVR